MENTATAPSTTASPETPTDASQASEPSTPTPTPNESVQASTSEHSVSNAHPMTLDDLLDITSEECEQFTDTNHTGMRPLKELLKHLPEDARKHLSNIRRSYTLKTQELSDQRKALEAEKARHRRNMSMMYDNDLTQRLDNITSNDEAYDIYSEDGMKKEIQRQAAQMMKDMLAPVREKLARDDRRLKLQQFKADHPDITSPEYKTDIAKTLMERPELKLEDAYYIVKARVDAEKLKSEREAVAREKATRRDALLQTSTGTASSAKGTPRFKNAWDAYVFHKAQKERN